MLIIICDDIISDREILHNYCNHYAKENRVPMTVMEFENAGTLLQCQDARSADVMLLDIYMDGMSGIDAAHILRQKGYRGALILTTTSQDYYADGYDVEAIHYLLKPISYQAFCESMRRVYERMNTITKKIRVTSTRNTFDIDISGIQYIEVYGHKTFIHTIKGDIKVNHSLVSLEERLGGDPFLRCYRYYIINMDFVKRMNDDSFLMKDNKEIPLSRDGRTALKNRYMSYIFKRMEAK
ncbi:LytR/AlgR family response regulator transcription factor [Candidatus Stoquefichus massiliensis]|uniref:LytR/AlgR family response regulator transcription factor n=1 Tax=Candidatus Stoquefichus massiliensis TaxID=1470350 RepID=UPI0004813E84|nr:LytTR family DNA-binding domain-containing protein [Candidatus Stoquefichus massiliensis]